MKSCHCIVVVLIFFLLSLQACATTVQPKCTHRALYQAVSFNKLTGRPVRIAIGPSDLGRHAQAQTQRSDGEWEWLEQGQFGVGTGYMDRVPGFEPNQYISVEHLLRWLGYTQTSTIPVKADTEIVTTSGHYSSPRSTHKDPVN